MEIPATDRLLHAHGFATDTPAHLRALTGDDAAAREAAVDHLATSVIHEGTPWPATGPVAAYVAHLVETRATDEDVHEALLDFLAEVADAVEIAEEDGGETQQRADLAELGRDLDAELALVHSAKDLELQFVDEEFADLVLTHAYLGVLSAAPSVRRALGN
ncbi:hypothetical protein [Litorihabitans aurantiacus]|uniref:Uncharacterized protein n=1 Tax=Litorihabitans aurantiacus TaxID=1930061 RepID=A0AA37XDM3_9MICO|nr:hypothetical protein [Litorihabitans aurantiacus]GMA30107.1 hypothetical protein GCM10025875_00990 [Litorihabitans aurantiacus]